MGKDGKGSLPQKQKSVIHVYSLEITTTGWDGCQEAFWRMGVGRDIVESHDEFWIKGGYSAYPEAMLRHHCDL